MKQEEETDKNNARVVRNLEERSVGTKEKSSKQDLISAKDLTIELPKGRADLQAYWEIPFNDCTSRTFSR